MKKQIKNLLLQSLCVLSGIAMTAPSATAAEEILLNFGPFQFALSVASLRTYAEEGKITGNLADYARFLSEEQLATLRKSLNTKADIEPLPISQFFYSYQGIKILERVGDIIESKAGQSGFHALRSALILSAASEEGLTPINFLETIPLKSVIIDSQQGFAIIDELSEIIQINQKAIATIEETAIVEAIQEDKTYPQGINPQGSISYSVESLKLLDRKRDRRLPVDLYIPQTRTVTKLPLIVISHGLGSDRTSFAYFAQFLASYGFAVAVPEHPGSNASQIQSLLEGFDNDVTPPEEFINRPLDISFIIDRLEAQYGNKIDTENVGIIGQSFGAYTALAVAGAELDFANLTQVCQNIDKSFNVSLFLQCLALELPPEEIRTDFRDERITSAIAINPLTSGVFGEAGMSQIPIPTMLISGSADAVTPALPEQIVPFTWLDSPNRYLVLVKGGTHFSALSESAGSIPVPPAAIGPDPKIGQMYIRQLGLLFFSDRYDGIVPAFGRLSPSYAASISQVEMPLSLISELDRTKLELLSSKKKRAANRS